MLGSPLATPARVQSIGPALVGNHDGPTPVSPPSTRYGGFAHIRADRGPLRIRGRFDLGSVVGGEAERKLLESLAHLWIIHPSPLSCNMSCKAKANAPAVKPRRVPSLGGFSLEIGFGYAAACSLPASQPSQKLCTFCHIVAAPLAFMGNGPTIS